MVGNIFAPCWATSRCAMRLTYDLFRFRRRPRCGTSGLGHKFASDVAVTRLRAKAPFAKVQADYKPTPTSQVPPFAIRGCYRAPVGELFRKKTNAKAPLSLRARRTALEPGCWRVCSRRVSAPPSVSSPYRNQRS
jgi:hypothetical protein